MQANCSFVKLRHTRNHIIAALVALCLMSVVPDKVAAAIPFYMLDLGIYGGTTYYVGELHEHIFMNPRYCGGLSLSYKYDYRWSFTAKSEFDVIAFDSKSNLPDNKMINTDVIAEFNFFRFDVAQYDPRIKPITPYIGLGLGFAIFGTKFTDNALYLPFTIGMKWKMAPRWTMKLSWQHQLYLFMDADKLENNANYNNTYKMNKANILRNDLTSALTLGITFSFARKNSGCRFCKD